MNLSSQKFKFIKRSNMMSFKWNANVILILELACLVSFTFAWITVLLYRDIVLGDDALQALTLPITTFFIIVFIYVVMQIIILLYGSEYKSLSAQEKEDMRPEDYVQTALDTSKLRFIFHVLLIFSIWIFLDLTVSSSSRISHQIIDEQITKAQEVNNLAVEDAEKESRGKPIFEQNMNTKKNWTQVEMLPINGWIVPARAGTGHIRIQLERICGRSRDWKPNNRLKCGWPLTSLEHNHTRSMADLEKIGSRSIMALIRRPSERLESFVRRNWMHDWDINTIFDISVAYANGDFKKFDKLRAGVHGLGTRLLYMIQPFENFLEKGGRKASDISSSRIAWICTHQLTRHWEAISGLTDIKDDETERDYICSQWLLDTGKKKCDSTNSNAPGKCNTCTFAEKKATPYGKQFKLTQEQRDYIDYELFREDTEFYSKICDGPHKDTQWPIVTDGVGNILGELAKTPGIANPWHAYETINVHGEFSLRKIEN